MRTVWSVVLLAAVASGDRFDDRSRAIEDAHAQGNAAELAKLAKPSWPDPWLLVEDLCQRGKHDAAEAFARLVKSKWVPRLPAYADARRKITVPQEAADAIDLADDLLNQKKKPAEAFALVSRLDRPLTDVNGIRLHYRRGRALADLRKFAEATDVFAETAKAADKLGWVQEAALAFQRAAEYAQLQSDLPRALRYAERRLAIEHLKPRAAEHAAAHFHIGVLIDGIGDYLDAVPHLQKALRLYRQQKDQAGELNSLVFLAQVQLHLGDGPKAHAMASEALQKARKQGGATLALCLAVTGAAYTMMGEYDEAEKIQREGLALDMSELGWAAGFMRSRFYAELGMIDLRRGDYAKALGFLDKEYAIKEKSGIVAGMAGNLNNRALVYTLIGDFDRAAEFYERAKKLSEKEGNAVTVASVLSNLGFIKLRQEKPEAALAVFEEARAVLADRKLMGQLPTVIGNIGFVLWQAGRNEEALEAYGEAMRLAREANDPLTVARITGNRGAVYNALGQHAEAISARRAALAQGEAMGSARLIYENSAGLARALLDSGKPAEAVAEAKRAIRTAHRLVAHLGNEQGAQARAQFSECYDIGAWAALETNDAATLCHFLESGRAGALLEALGGRARLRDSALPPELRRAEAEALAAEKVAEFALRQARKHDEIKARRKELAEAREALRRVVERIQREARRAAELLYPEAAPLADIQTTLRDGEALVLYALPEQGALALVVTRDAARAVRLGDPAAILAAREDPQALARKVVAPLALDRKIRRVLVSPDGALSYAPFVLSVPDREVAYVPSGTTYRMLAAEGARSGRDVLALGDPRYPRAMRLPALPGTRAEAEAVGDLVLLGEQATEPALRSALGEIERWRAIHLGCHGLVDLARPTLSALVLTPTDEDDGYLRALEVYRMKIPADLVVLSACETAKGKVYKAEGVVGFTRAFLFAGAPRVIVSLWKVDDNATRALMVKFYELWKTRGTAAALREAQRHVAAQPKWKDPKYWAAWQLWGLPD